MPLQANTGSGAYSPNSCASFASTKAAASTHTHKKKKNKNVMWDSKALAMGQSCN